MQAEADARAAALARCAMHFIMHASPSQRVIVWSYVSCPVAREAGAHKGCVRPGFWSGRA